MCLWVKKLASFKGVGLIPYAMVKRVNLVKLGGSFPKFLRFTYGFNFLKVWVEGYKVNQVNRFDVRKLHILCGFELGEADSKSVNFVRVGSD